MSSRFHTPPEIARRLVALVVEACDGRLPGGLVLEPSVGAGALVLAWLEREAGGVDDLASARRAAGLVRARLRATDIDPRAVAATRRALVERCAPHLAPDDPALEHVRLGDGLSGADRAGLILCNPPWVSYSGRHRGPAEAAAPAEPPRPRGQGWPSLHARAVSSLVAGLADEGAAGFVLPGQVASLAGYAALRRQLAARVRFVEVLGEGVFPGVVSPSCLVALGPASSAPLVTLADGRRSAIARATLLADPDRPWLPRLEDGFASWPPPGFRLVPEAFADLGMHSGNAASRLFAPAPFPGAEGVLEGRDVAPFAVAAPRRWFDPSATPRAGEYFRLTGWERARDCPIVLRQTASRPIAARNPGHPFRNSVLGCRGVPGVSDEAVVALLNSDVMATIFRALAPDVRQRAFPQVKIGALRRLPWPADAFSEKVRELEHLAGELAPFPVEQRRRRRPMIEDVIGDIYQSVLVAVGPGAVL